MNNFLTVSKAPNAAWDEIRKGVVAALAKHGFRATETEPVAYLTLKEAMPIRSPRLNNEQ
ncbi:MAG: hypothetical protein NZ844_03550 [Chloroherpetonaceae bacterium]|nr:hypothetical protein [Chloroherpetonaceae bacterium]